MTQRSLLMVLCVSLLFGCSQGRRPGGGRRAQRTATAQQLDAETTRLPVELWGNQLASSSRSERKDALDHLAYYGTAAVPYIPAIVQDLTGHDDSLGLTAAWSLAHIGAPAYPPLARELGNRDSAVRHRAAYGLGVAGPDVAGSARQRLDSLSKNDPVKKVRDMAAWALDQITPRPSVGDPNLGELEGLNSDSLEVRLEAVRRLGAAPAWDRTATNQLIRLLADTSDVFRESVIDALVQKGKGALPMLNTALNSPRERVRSGAMAATARIRGQF